jgi:hypothetical protein
MIRDVHPGSRVRILIFYPSRIPDPGVKKAPDPRSATLVQSLLNVSTSVYISYRYSGTYKDIPMQKEVTIM